jgi:NAD(P)-dependent dehydrogenase (short-subunit alcohol dehydrogenase family)
MSLPQFNYDRKRVVVTGTASGMGRAAARLLAEDGAEVHALDLAATDLPGVQSYEVDLRDSQAVREVAAQLPDGIDALLNCAGVGRLPNSLDVAKVNFIGLRRLTEELLPKIPAGGAVGNIASKSGGYWPRILSEIEPVLAIDDDEAAAEWFEQHPRMSDPYGFSKACVVVYTMARAAELAPQRIRMNSIAPGATMTGFFRGADPLENESLRKSIANIGRLSEPEEQALPLIFLCSDAASYVSGINLIVDAGNQGGYITGRVEPPALAPYEGIRTPPVQIA